MPLRKKILFLCNAVTLAHPARSVTLAKGLNPEEYEVVLYMDDHYDALLGELPFRRHSLGSMKPQEFSQRLSQGKPLFNAPIVKAELARDFEILEKEKPDLVIGDMRITLQVSARKLRIPYLNLTNAYWSPYAKQRYPMPDLPITRVTGYMLAETVLNLAHPLIFLSHTSAINHARRSYGMQSHGGSLKQAYTDADFVAYCDLESLIPLPGMAGHHRHIGPVLWAPENMPLPKWWDDIPANTSSIYVNLGSSGNSALLPQILRVLSKLDARIIAATAGANIQGEFPSNIYLAKWLPGDRVCEKASIVISNGGNPSTMQALAGGAYSIGLCNNMDQHMNMQYLEMAGVGISCKNIEHLPDIIIAQSNNKNDQVNDYQNEIKKISAVKNISGFIDQILSR